MRNSQTMAEVVELYRSGLKAVADVTARFETESWSSPACGHWDGADTARHLLSVADWYHVWLDRALDGDTSRPFPEDEIDAQTAKALADYRDLPGPEAIVNFKASAERYLERAVPAWDLPFSYPFGTSTVGLHAGLAATEWHVHAWDLSATGADRHRPDDGRGLLLAAAYGVAGARGGRQGQVLRLMVPLAARRSPWSKLLKRSGRENLH